MIKYKIIMEFIEKNMDINLHEQNFISVFVCQKIPMT